MTLSSEILRPEDSPAQFEILEHTADVGFRAWGSTPADVFLHAARALLSFTSAPGSPECERNVELRAEDYESLLVDWLSEILYLFDSGDLVLAGIAIVEISPTLLRARLTGSRRRLEHWRLIVKAVTYHQIEVAEKDGRWQATVYLDV